MNITLKYKHVDFMFRLLDIPLHGQERIERDHFSRYLILKANETESFRLSLLKELSKKDEKNQPIMKPDNTFDITPENEEKFKKEMMEYLDSDMIIDVLDSNKKEEKKKEIIEEEPKIEEKLEELKNEVEVEPTEEKNKE